ncbi:uncharacterized protein P174DRAFT_467876 [Aspergillus novofumigatus IBT 16806]|uniref:Uncharacterized protein n=1 Tax=Aspergillus novofumigatus (strain IBT 16806) TaxID=1392255 RepID=A0A2I1CME1_ASPN1|nr:uncharacterized protein P174DRAFT_467876 [Aspergillus novofumigatus IBT 16806]PKX98789.1 hypothetical protein P174DRAFT_467876 [Aspergillus novofumigatus IBT 16806]
MTSEDLSIAKQTLSSSLALRSPLRSRNRIERPATPPTSCEELTHYPVFNPRDPRHNPAASASLWLQSDYYRSQASRTQNSVSWMQDLPRRSLRKARSGLLALRSGMQRRPLPGGHARRSDIPSIWSSRDSTEGSSDRFPSSVSDASTEDDHEFGTGLYRTARNHSSSSEALKDHSHNTVPPTSLLPCTVREGLEGTGLRNSLAAQEKRGVNGTSEAGVDEHVTVPEHHGHIPDGSSTLAQTSTHATSNSPSASLIEVSRIEATTEHTASSETSKAASQKSPINSQPSEDCMKDLCSQAHDSTRVSSNSQVINPEKPTAALSPEELVNPNGPELNESTRGHEIAQPPIASGSTDSMACVYVSSRSPSRSSSVSSRESTFRQIPAVQLMMGTLELFSSSRECSSGGQTLCCSDVAENDLMSRAIHHAPADHTEDRIVPVETGPQQSRASNAGETQVTHAGASFTEPSEARSSAQEEETASCLLPALDGTDSLGIQNSSDPRAAQRPPSPSQTEDGASDSDFIRSSIEIDDALASLIFRDEFFFVDGKSSDIAPDRGDNPIKTGRRIARDGGIYSGPGLDRTMSVRTQEIPEIVGPGTYASRRSNLSSLERNASDSTDECIVTYPMWERRQFP